MYSQANPERQKLASVQMIASENNRQREKEKERRSERKRGGERESARAREREGERERERERVRERGTLNPKIVGSVSSTAPSRSCEAFCFASCEYVQGLGFLV